MQKRKRLSRREMLILLGLGGAGVATVCGGAAGILWLLARGEQRPVIYVTATPSTEAAIPPAQTPLAVERPPVVARAAWGALPPNHDARYESGFYSEDNPDGWRVYPTELHEAYQTVIIHHSVEYEADDASTLLYIQQLHREDRGWADVAYHFLVGKNGLIYEGRDLHVRGTHVGGYNNGSVGVCLLGNFMEEPPTQAQIASTQALINWLAARLQLTHLAAHREFNANTVCPGDNLVAYMGQFAGNAGLERGTEGYIPPDGAT